MQAPVVQPLPTQPLEEPQELAVHALPAQTVPTHALPPQTLPAQALPPQTLAAHPLPAQLLPAHPLVPQADETQTLPAQTEPTQTEPTQTLPAQTDPAQTLPGLTLVTAGSSVSCGGANEGESSVVFVIESNCNLDCDSLTVANNPIPSDGLLSESAPD